MSKRTLICASFLLWGVSLFGIEVKEGLVKASVDEASARLSVYKLIDVAKAVYEPYYFVEDKRTSYASLSADGKQYKLGDSTEFQKTISRTDRGLKIEFRSSFALVTQNVEFARSSGSALADGVRVTYIIENVSQKESAIGLRFLLDTSLGEKGGIHFKTPSKEKVQEELIMEGAGVEPWVRSQGEKLDFMILFSASAAEKPDRVHLANWKRLNDAPWIADATGSRSFTLLPYSVNDSAIAVYWSPQAVPRGGSRKLSFVLGSFNEGGYPTDQAGASQTSSLFSQTVLNAPSADKSAAIAADLVAVRDLISRIDLVLSSGNPPSAEELEAWKKILDLLETRKKEY